MSISVHAMRGIGPCRHTAKTGLRARAVPRTACSGRPRAKGMTIVRIERMSRAFTQYHLDDGRALHRFTAEEPHATHVTSICDAKVGRLDTSYHVRTMGGRVKRMTGLKQAEARTLCASEVDRCSLCERALGRKIEWHHRIPKSRGGTEIMPVHPICHRIIHASVSNQDLATNFADLSVLKARPDIERFLRWIADKPPDFHAPTHRPDPR